MNKEVIKIITIFIGIPIILSSYNLSLTYKINKLKLKIKDKIFSLVKHHHEKIKENKK
jgi:hypothetical protein